MERIYSNSSIENNDYVNHLGNISRHVLLCICLFYVIIGNIGGVFKIFFFLQKPVRVCPCVVYILAATINNFIILNNLPVLKILSSIYQSKKWIHITIIKQPVLLNKQNEVFRSNRIQICKIINYIHMWSTDVSVYFLVFASINRYLTSLKKLNRRTYRRLNNLFCDFPSAIKISFTYWIIWSFISLHHYFNFNIVSNSCTPNHFILWVIWVFVIHCLIPSILMIIFSTLTLMNLRKNSKTLRRQYRNDYRRAVNFLERYQTQSNRFNRHHIEQQLTSMIIIETIGTILTTLPYATYVLYQAMKTQNETSLELFAREDFIEQIIRLTMYLEPTCGFYLYLFTLSTLKRRFFRILFNKIRYFWC